MPKSDRMFNFWRPIWKSVKVESKKYFKNWFLSKNLLPVDLCPQNSTTKVMVLNKTLKKHILLFTLKWGYDAKVRKNSRVPASMANFEKYCSEIIYLSFYSEFFWCTDFKNNSWYMTTDQSPMFSIKFQWSG